MEKTDTSALATERCNLINLLHDTDYRIIKCAEASLLGLTLPYDIEALHAERQGARDRMEAIDAELKAIAEAQEPETMEA